ncbi:SANT/Myb_domain [Hexamita inflata]|uniref:SANT/Myb domain n=1 Tax=Hexamita inflata TaxID=28002 RepID=A0AA86P7I3_9EUKA|nr:SANT/Myb domain [Hexamita inflata]CAI9933332.1 SANT/Myb domain [Hexamita inflata]
MIQMNILDALKDNYLVLNQIHQYAHMISRYQSTNSKKVKDKWSCEEDQLMESAISIFGTNCIAISEVVSSKSAAQVYQRMRYLRERRARSQCGSKIL